MVTGRSGYCLFAVGLLTDSSFDAGLQTVIFFVAGFLITCSFVAASWIFQVWILALPFGLVLVSFMDSSFFPFGCFCFRLLPSFRSPLCPPWSVILFWTLVWT
ncbi:hypothetical protein ILYODFUR_029121 [Ilyodon furcidens]|uniref:Uncharacterized protein n=1 Tax=Ilyodon furcidens TaxID=33524 RepID=A0ABV0UC46_9TELE